MVQEYDDQIPIRNHDKEFPKRTERIVVLHLHIESVDPPKVAVARAVNFLIILAKDAASY